MVSPAGVSARVAGQASAGFAAKGVGDAGAGTEAGAEVGVGFAA